MAGASEEEDRRLASLAAAGDADAFTTLVRRHERKVRAFLSRLCRGVGADDLAQDTFLQAWRMAGSFRGEGSYKGWLLGIAWRQFLTRERVSRREAATPADETPVLHATPEIGLDVDRAFASLEPRERAAALLCFSHEYSHSEAAAILDLPLGTLKSLVARARSQLMEFLGGAGS